MTIGENDWPYFFAVVPIEKFVIDQSYQRPSKPDWITNAKDKFEARLVGALTASQRDEETYALIDGQQRWLLLKELGFETAPALVHQGLNPRQEAQLFAQLNFETSLLRTWFHYRALRRARDPEIVAIDKLVESHGYQVGDDYGRENFLSCPGTIVALWRGDTDMVKDKTSGPEILGSVLQLLNLAWRDRVTEGWPKAKGAGMVRGIARWIARHPDVPLEDIAEILQPVHPETIITEASLHTKGTGSGKGRKIEAVIDLHFKKKSRGSKAA